MIASRRSASACVSWSRCDRRPRTRGGSSSSRSSRLVEARSVRVAAHRAVGLAGRLVGAAQGDALARVEARRRSVAHEPRGARGERAPATAGRAGCARAPARAAGRRRCGRSGSSGSESRSPARRRRARTRTARARARLSGSPRSTASPDRAAVRAVAAPAAGAPGAACRGAAGSPNGGSIRWNR